jgi:hypothetical protein
MYLILYSRIQRQTDETVTAASAVLNDCYIYSYNIDTCFHLCKGVNCGTHCGKGNNDNDDQMAYVQYIFFKTGALLIAQIHGYLLGLKSIKTSIVGLQKILINLQ